MSTSASDIAACCAAGSWRTLADKALSYLTRIQPRFPVPIAWALGGGTRLMLEFEHRISDDIDVFIPDPSISGLLSPVLNDEIAEDVTNYVVDHGAIKLYYQGFGEIDFIFCSPLIGGAAQPCRIDSRLQLEPVSEVFAKKLFHRGNRITPRDVFDWWYVGTHAPHELDASALARVLHSRLDGIDDELRRLQQIDDNPDLIASPMAAWSKIRSPYLPSSSEALAWARAYVRDLKSQTSDG